MYRVLIVDDEPLIREGLRTIVNWEEHGFVVAGSASDGLEGLQKTEKLAPDLVIVDVRMPGMDGLNLIRAVRERSRPKPHFLILSGHADFEYARRALEMKAEGYLLKPVDEDELTEHLAKMKSILDEESRKEKAPPAEWSGERIVASLLAGDFGSVPEEAVAGAGLDGDSFEVVLIKPQSREEIDGATTARVKRKLSETYEPAGRGVVFSMDPYLGIVLKNSAGDPGALDAACRAIARACADSGLEFTAVSGGAVARLDELERSYRNARERMKSRFALEGGKVHVWEPPASEGHAGGGAAGGGKEAPDLNAAGEKLLLALDIGNADTAAELIRGTGEAMLEVGMTEQEIKAGFAQMLTMALGKLAQNRPELKEKVQAYSSAVPDIYAEYRFSGLIGRLTALAREMAEPFRGCGGDKQVQRMIELIRRNYSENLKLESLAEVFNYNSSYLGKLFKQTTGVSFNTYLDQVRIEKAKELLAAGMKVYQVAERVGYANVDYFHGKFRKYVGVSPSEYRKRLH